MTQVRQDIGILNNTFIGRGINVGMIESGSAIATGHTQLNGVTINRGGANNQTPHSLQVARTFVGSLGIASGVEALHSFAVLNLNLVDAMNWLLQPARNVRLINRFGLIEPSVILIYNLRVTCD